MRYDYLKTLERAGFDKRACWEPSCDTQKGGFDWWRSLMLSPLLKLTGDFKGDIPTLDWSRVHNRERENKTNEEKEKVHTLELTLENMYLGDMA